MSCSVELAGVLAVGTWSVLDPASFPDATVWSTYGVGYGFVPLVLPVFGLLWLRRWSKRARTEPAIVPAPAAVVGEAGGDGADDSRAGTPTVDSRRAAGFKPWPSSSGIASLRRMCLTSGVSRTSSGSAATRAPATVRTAVVPRAAAAGPATRGRDRGQGDASERVVGHDAG